MYFTGIDMGSTCTKLIVLDEGGAIAYGIVESIATKVKGQMGQLGAGGRVYLTGGLCETPFVIDMLSQKLGTEVISAPLARYAGAIGAAMFARDIFVKKLDSVKQ